MKCYKRIIPLILACMMLAGCGQNVYKKGVESLENKDYEAAQENFRKAVEEKKNVADSYRGLGIAYYEQEKYKDALAAFENAVSAGTKETGTICNMMAVCKMQTENYEDAISYYEKALDHSDCSDDMKQEIQFNVIVCYEKLEDWDNAKAKLEDYVTAYPDDEKAAISTFFDYFYDDARYTEWVDMEGFLPATKSGGEALAAANEDMASWIDILDSCKFYPTAKAEWADVKQGVINVEQNALLGGDVQELLDDLQAEIAG